MKQRLFYNLAILCLLTLSVSLLAQNAPVDFETDGNGGTWYWETFENEDNPPLEVIANPDMSGVNTSGMAGKFTARAGGMPWAGCITNGIGEFTFDETNSTVKIMVWKSVISDVGVKFEFNGASSGEIKVPNTLVNQWEELTFDFSGKIGETNNNLVIFPDFTERTEEHVIYFDNLTFSEQIIGAGPAMPAPNPFHTQGNVISMFSDLYEDVLVDTWSAVWDQADVTDYSLMDNNMKKYSNLVFAGIEFGTAPIDATEMTHFHMDIWTPDPVIDPSNFEVKLVDFGADGVYGNGDDSEHSIFLNNLTVPSMVTEEWISLDLPLADFTSLLSREHLAQLILAGEPNTLYVDNVYFHNSNGPATAAPDPVEPAENVISLFSGVYDDVLIDTWSAVWDVADLADVSVYGNDTKLYTNLSFAGIEFGTQPINANSMTHFHMDIWTDDPIADPLVFKVKLVDFGIDGVYGGGDDSEYELSLNDVTTPAITQGEWSSLNIAMDEFVGLSDAGHIAQLIISGDPNTVYVDNVYFFNDGTSSTQVNVDVLEGWNLVSVPVMMEEMTVSSIFPTASTDAFYFDGQYTPTTDLTNGTGYWLKFDAPESISLEGDPVFANIPLAEGWNIFGVYDQQVSVSNLVTEPAGIFASNFFGFDGTYNSTDVLIPGKGYWVKTSAAGMIVNNVAASKKSPLFESIDNSWIKLTLTDNVYNSFNLYIAQNTPSGMSFELPPVAPAGAFDARFESGKYVESAGSDQVINISTLNYPVIISVSSGSYNVSYLSNGSMVNEKLSEGNSITISDENVASLKIMEMVEITSYALEQNYPNPFNPTTSIKFAIPTQSDVVLEVYNLLGQKVATLVNGNLAAGYHEVEFNASELSSGIYLYSLRAGDFSKTAKMMLLK